MAPLNAMIERARSAAKFREPPCRRKSSRQSSALSFYRRWFSRERLDDHFLQGVVERAMLALKSRS